MSRGTLVPVVQVPAKSPQTTAGEPLRSSRAARLWGMLPSSVPLSLTILGLLYWVFGVNSIHPSDVGISGLLTDSNAWFVSCLVLLALGFLLELSRPRPRSLVMGCQIVSLIVAIHGTVPRVYGTPEYAWVYRHLGIVGAFEHFGRITDPTNIYQQWPVLFAAVAAVASLAHISPATLAVWAPTAFELADALLLMGIFRLVGGERRAAWLALLLYEGLIAWVGQDYLSPQAFAYLLSLGMILITLRWLRRPADLGSTRLARLRAPLLRGLPPAAQTTPKARLVAVTLVLLTYVAIVAAHQLTPYLLLADVGALTLLDLLRPRWLVAVLVVIAGAYLAPRYHIIAGNFGGLFSGGNPVANSSGVKGTHNAGTESTTALFVRALSIGMWLLSLAAILRARRTLGRVAIPAVLAFAPFLVLGAQSYGGEAIYRVYLFSSPWCALLIARTAVEMRFPRRPAVRWSAIAVASVAALFAGLQGLYGPVAPDTFSPTEVTASHWLYRHMPRGSTFVLPVDNFPGDEADNYNDYGPQVMPSDPQVGAAWLNEANLPRVRSWLTSLGGPEYMVVSRSMILHFKYYGEPRGYPKLIQAANPSELRPKVARELRATVAYHTTDTTIYRMRLPLRPNHFSQGDDDQ